MKILNPYRFCKGSGGSNPPVPALMAPFNQNLLKSISVAETVDLLCEGPIYGLVDQFGKKVYGLDMLKGIYLNKIPVMNYDGKYNFRNVVMEINFGTENQKPLENFKNIYIYKPANFKLLGPITTDRDIRLRYSEGIDQKFGIPKGRVIGQEDFTSWATGWPTEAQDPFVFVHHIKNKDVKKIKIGLIVEALFDTIDQGSGKGEGGRMGMSKSTDLTLSVCCGVEGSNIKFIKEFTINGTVQSPYACMIGESVSQFDSAASVKSYSSTGGGLANTFSALFGINTRNPSNPVSQLKAQEPQSQSE